jgi:aminoglycoside 2'-N-acetyltransferase I
LPLQLEVIPSSDLNTEARSEIIALCDRAYGRAMAPYFDVLPDPTHVIGRVDGMIVSHAMWGTRWLQTPLPSPLPRGERGQGWPLLGTAYVEMVATDPRYQRRGYAAAVMRRLAASVHDYDLGALCPSDAGEALYAELGWEYWRGPLSIRRGHEVIPTPDERVMVLRLPRTHGLDLDAPLSAEWREGELW